MHCFTVQNLIGFGLGSLLQQLLDPALLVDRGHGLVATRLPTAAVLGLLITVSLKPMVEQLHSHTRPT